MQRELGCKNAWAFDATAACSGFVVGLITASRFIKGDLVIEFLSGVSLGYQDKTSVL